VQQENTTQKANRLVMQPQDPQFREKTLAAIQNQPFAHLLGMTPTDAGPGWVDIRLEIAPQHTQHDGLVHGGVVAALADTAAALAAHTLIPKDRRVVTIEFKINFLRPASEGFLMCRGQVLRPGRSVSVAEAEITNIRGGSTVLIAKALATVAVLSDDWDSGGSVTA
jgi:uncharacterized protein (TIGR00369 family)